VVDPAAVVEHIDLHRARAYGRFDPYQALTRFARGEAVVRCLDAVYDRVSGQVAEHVGGGVDQRPIDGCGAAASFEADFLAPTVGLVVDQPPKPAEQGADRHHAQFEHLRLHVLEQPFEFVPHFAAGFDGVGRDAIGRRSGRGQRLAHPMAGKQLSTQFLDQAIEPLISDAHSLGLTATGAAFFLPAVQGSGFLSQAVEAQEHWLNVGQIRIQEVAEVLELVGRGA